MKLATVRTPEGTAVVRIDGEVATEIPGFADVGALLRGPGLPAAEGAAGPVHAVADLDYAPLVLSPGKIFCVGHNYRTHIAEMGREIPAHPVLFAKFADTLIGAGDDIALPPESAAVDWECELAIVVGSAVRRARGEEAEAAIAGYTVANDVSMRDWQFRTLEWLQGKTWTRSTPLGPVLATADEIPAESAITTVVNGVEKQRAEIHDLVFSPAFLIEYISTLAQLEPGDVILTGTPGGVGHAREPKEYLREGDVVTIAVEGIGAVSNTVVTEAV